MLSAIWGQRAARQEVMTLNKLLVKMKI